MTGGSNHCFPHRAEYPMASLARFISQSTGMIFYQRQVSMKNRREQAEIDMRWSEHVHRSLRQLLVQGQLHSVRILSIRIYAGESWGKRLAGTALGSDSQYFFSMSLTVNPSVSRYKPSAARFDRLTCNET